MSTQQRRRSSVASAIPADWLRVASTFLLSAIAIPSIGILLLVRAPLVLPSISMMALACASIIAVAAWCMPSDHHSDGISLWGISGAYAFIGLRPTCSAILSM